MTNTTQNVGSQHEHQFNAQGVCGCGKTHDDWRAEHEAELASKQQPAQTVDTPPAETGEQTQETTE